MKRLAAEEPGTPRGGPDNKTEAHPSTAAESSEQRKSSEIEAVPKLQIDTSEGTKTEEKRPRRSSSKNADGADGSKSPRDKQKREKRHKDKSAKTPRDRRPSESEDGSKAVPDTGVDVNVTKSGSLEPPKSDNGAATPEMTPRTAEEYSLLTQIYTAVAPSKASMVGNKRATIAAVTPEKQTSKSNVKAPETSAEAPEPKTSTEKTLGVDATGGPQTVLRT